MAITNYFANMTDFQKMLEIPNLVTGGWFWLGMEFLIFIVLTVTFLGYGIEVAVLTAGFIALISSLFLVYMELLAWQWLMFFLGIILFTIFYVIWNNRKNI